MKTPHNDATEFLSALYEMNFWATENDKPGKRILRMKNDAGHPVVQVKLDYEGEPQPHSISILRFTGEPNRMVEWASDHMSAHMPSDGLLALIKASH